MSTNANRPSLRIVGKTDTAISRPATHRSDIIEFFQVFGLCAVLIFGVLAFGCVDAWSMHIFEVATAVLFAVWASEQLAFGELNISKNPLYLPALLFFGLVIAQLALHRTAYAYATLYETLQYVSYGMVLLIAAEGVSKDSARRSFALVMAIFGILYAFFAVVQSLTSKGKIFWVHTPQFGRDVFGSYVNRNHFAGVMEMLVPLPLVLSTGYLLQGGRRVLVAFGGALMAATIFLCRSRAGIVVFGLQLVLFAVLSFRRARSRAAIGSATGFALVAVLLIFFGNWQFLGRFRNLDPGIRVSIMEDSLRMFLKRPVSGWGLGTFPTVYPEYRSFYTNLFVNEAHNDYAQLLVETGLLGFALMIWFITAMYKRGLSTTRYWQHRWDAALSFAALLGCSGILLHSFVDFNLQIPANAALFYAWCALAACQVSPQGARSRVQDRDTKMRERHLRGPNIRPSP